MNSSRFTSKCSDKKEKLEDSTIHDQSVPKKATTPKYKKLKKPKRQYEIDDDSEINLFSNLKNNNEESGKVI